MIGKLMIVYNFVYKSSQLVLVVMYQFQVGGLYHEL